MLARVLLTISISCFAALPAQAQELFSGQMTLLVEGNARTLYYESNHDIGVAGNTIERVIVIVHGAGRTNVSYERLLDAATDNGIENETLIFAPQFLVGDDIAANALGPEALFWPNGWRQGHLSVNNGLGRISSFELVNRIVGELVANNPNVADVVIAGHSAGGQYGAALCGNQPVGAGAGRDLRHGTGALRARQSFVDGVHGQQPQARKQCRAFAVPAGAACPDYDDYKYGLGGNLNRFVTRIGGADQVRAQYPTRDVRYLLGENDDDANSSSLDTGCEAMLQGRHRLERGIVYYNHIRDVFGESVHDVQIKTISPRTGHTSSIFTTDCGLNFLFDIGACGFVTPTQLALTVDGGSGAVSLSWVDRSTGESNYEVFRSDDGGNTFTLLTTLPADTAAYDDQTATAAMQYRYRVRAVKDNGRSGISNTATANPGASPPPLPPPPSPSPPPVNNGLGGGGMPGTAGLLGLLLFAAMRAKRQSPKRYRKPIE